MSDKDIEEIWAEIKQQRATLNELPLIRKTIVREHLSELERAADQLALQEANIRSLASGLNANLEGGGTDEK